MLGYVETKSTFMTASTMTVPTRSYTDPDQFEAEMDLVFKRVPLMLAFTAEVPKPGDYKAMDVIGLPVLINRDKTGAVRAFLNVCAHRGEPDANEGHGNCPRFICKYHGWTYGQDGKLIGISEASTFGTVDKSERGLKQLPCGERSGMIFVGLTPDTQINLDEYFAGFLNDFEAASLKGWTFLGTRVIGGANWKIAFDG